MILASFTLMPGYNGRPESQWDTSDTNYFTNEEVWR